MCNESEAPVTPRLYSPQKMKLVLLVVLVCFSCKAQDSSDHGKPANSVSEWGEGFNTPGAMLAIHLINKQRRNDGAEYGFYDFYVTGFPADRVYTIFQWPLGKSEPQEIMPAYVSNNGRLCMEADKCHDDSGPYVTLALLALPGLPHLISVASEDRRYRAAAAVVPWPIIAEDQGCSVEVIRAHQDFSLALLRGKGFSPNAEVKFTSNSAGETLKGSIKTNASGGFNQAFGPGVKGKLKGNDTIDFKAPACAPSVSYHWGSPED